VQNNALAEDIAQEAFVRAFRAWSSFDEERSPWPWLLTITRNLMMDMAAATRGLFEESLPESADRDARFAATASGPERTVLAMELGEAIRSTLATLDARERRLLLLRCEGMLSYDEIAFAENVSRDSVKSTLKRTRQRFRVSFASRYGEVGVVGAIFKRYRSIAQRVRTSALGARFGSNIDVRLSVPLIAAAMAVCAAVGAAHLATSKNAFTAAPLGGSNGTHTRDSASRADSSSFRSTKPRSGLVPAPRGADTNSPFGVGASVERDKTDRRTVRIDRRNRDPRTKAPDHSHLTVEIPCTGFSASACATIDSLVVPAQSGK
jgi:RNA polymerase sigma-70 factor (ECF subfamily)